MNSNGFVGCGSKLATGISAPGDSGRDEAQPAADATPDVSVAGFDDAPADAPAVVAPSSACNTGAPTSVSGKVYDPAGKNPVFNVTVYVPVGSLPPIGLGTAVCDPGAPRPTGLICNSTLGAVAGTAITTTDATGAFRIDGVPAGKNIPLVFQLGKWRREIVLPQIDPCTDYPVPAAMSRLPRNQGEGDIPQLAIVTGSCDRLACLLDKVGLDPVEFTSPGAGGRVHVYQGAGQAPGLSDGGAGSCSEDAGACPLWSTKQALERYDGVLLGCECGEHNETKPDKTPMHDWLDEGGRVLAVHYGSTWFRNGPSDFQSVATWNVASDAGSPGPFQFDTTTPSGNALRNWFTNLSVTAGQSLPLDPANVSASVDAVARLTDSWIYSGTAPPGQPSMLSFATPVGGLPVAPDAAVGPALYCGKVVFSDVHAGGQLPNSTPVLSGCVAGAMSPEEETLEYAFFSLWSTCDSAAQSKL